MKKNSRERISDKLSSNIKKCSLVTVNFVSNDMYIAGVAQPGQRRRV